MSFSKSDLENIKSKISLRSEIEKKTRVIQKGSDFWCNCLFHEEKTPSCKINEDQASFYCFGCGAKGDIFTLYTDLYNYTFLDAVKELSQQVGVIINFNDTADFKKENIAQDILELAAKWFNNNLNNAEANVCNQYLKNRNLSKETIKNFQLGYSFNSKTSLYAYLKNKSFSDADLLKSNIVKFDKNKKIKDFFYKRLIFPIRSIQGRVVGFGGRALDNSNPKYINSPESNLFQKRYLLYNLDKAKLTARKKRNILISEGYMDVISLYQNGITSIVAPLGTALTEDQLKLAWKYSPKPTIMFDGDSAGIRASYKVAIMALPLISDKNFIQFVELPNGYDPDSFINKLSLQQFIRELKKPQSLITYIFNQSSKSISLSTADEKISFDKYIDDLVSTIKDQKTQYFYKNEFKNLFFEKIRTLRSNKNTNTYSPKKKLSNLQQMQILSFIISAINHLSVGEKIIYKILETDILKTEELRLVKDLKDINWRDVKKEDIFQLLKKSESANLLKNTMNSQLYQLFPYASPLYDPQKAYEEVIKSLENLNTRLSNLKKINKSLNTFIENSNTLNWSELQNINMEIKEED